MNDYPRGASASLQRVFSEGITVTQRNLKSKCLKLPKSSTLFFGEVRFGAGEGIELFRRPSYYYQEAGCKQYEEYKVLHSRSAPDEDRAYRARALHGCFDLSLRLAGVRSRLILLPRGLPY